jgi:hypothetical protein
MVEDGGSLDQALSLSGRQRFRCFGDPFARFALYDPPGLLLNHMELTGTEIPSGAGGQI